MKTPLQVNVCSENWILLPLASNVIGICTYKLSNSAYHSGCIKYLVLSLDSGPTWTYDADFRKDLNTVLESALGLYSPGNTQERRVTDWTSGQDEKNQFPSQKAQTKGVNKLSYTIWIFDSVSENPSERFVLYVRQSYSPLVLSYSKTNHFYFPFMSNNNHIFPSVKDMQNIE